MANNIALITKFINFVDKVYKRDSVTGILEPAADFIRSSLSNAKTIEVMKLVVEGASDVTRNGDLTASDATLAWESIALTKERGAALQLNLEDQDESGLGIMMILDEYIRTKAVPELDAYRFYKFANGAGNSGSSTPTADNSFDLLDDALATMEDFEVSKENLILYVSNTFYKLMKQYPDNLRMIAAAGDTMNVNRSIASFDDIPIIKVPKTRFSTGCTLGSKTYTQTGKYIDFMFVDRSSVLPLKKNERIEIVPSKYNTAAFRDVVKYKVYHDAFVLENRVNGVYYNANQGV